MLDEIEILVFRVACHDSFLCCGNGAVHDGVSQDVQNCGIKRIQSRIEPLRPFRAPVLEQGCLPDPSIDAVYLRKMKRIRGLPSKIPTLRPKRMTRPRRYHQSAGRAWQDS